VKPGEFLSGFDVFVALYTLACAHFANGQSQIATKLFLFGAFVFQFFEKSVVSSHDVDERACRPRKQSGNSNDRADNAVLRIEVHLTISGGGVGVPAEVDSVLCFADEADTYARRPSQLLR